jgi:hypothetical protein
MRTAGVVDCSPYGLVCTECDELVIAPELAEYLGKREVRHFWCCENCGYKLEMMVDLRVSAACTPAFGVELSRPQAGPEI